MKSTIKSTTKTNGAKASTAAQRAEIRRLAAEVTRDMPRASAGEAADEIASRIDAAEAKPATTGGYYEADSVLVDALESLDTMTSRAAYIHADPEANGANDTYLREFNAAAAATRASILLMQELLVANGIVRLAEVTS